MENNNRSKNLVWVIKDGLSERVQDHMRNTCGKRSAKGKKIFRSYIRWKTSRGIEFDCGRISG